MDQGRHAIDWNETPFYSWAGLRLIEEERGTSRVELDVQDHHRGSGISRMRVNGGIVSYIFDGLLGAAGASTRDEDVLGQVTVSLNINFLDAIEAEERVEGTARVVRAGRSLVYAEGQVFDEAGKIGATCTGIYKLFRDRRGTP